MRMGSRPRDEAVALEDEAGIHAAGGCTKGKKWYLYGERVKEGRTSEVVDPRSWEGAWDVPTRRSGRCQSAESAPGNVLTANAPPWRAHCGLR